MRWSFNNYLDNMTMMLMNVDDSETEGELNITMNDDLNELDKDEDFVVSL